jgi:hypothetical protein
MTFQLDMARIGDNYADSRVFSNWQFGATGYEVPLQVSASDNTPYGSVTINRDRMYTITVEGDHNAHTLKAYISGNIPIDVSEFTM